MRHLESSHPKEVKEWGLAVGAAALLHDIGHIAPGSHLAERVWGGKEDSHERLGIRVISEDQEINSILERYEADLATKVTRILRGDENLPPWTVQTISGGGWNADRGNWTIVDSAMCAVSYGRYNVFALLDAFRLSDRGELVLHESRLDALTHFFVARDSMYRQVYQHRVLQAVDSLTENIIRRVVELFSEKRTVDLFLDDVLQAALQAGDYVDELTLTQLFSMSEPWWGYHLEQWCECSDPILSDLSRRLRDRRLFKTIRLEPEEVELEDRARQAATELGLDPRYYVIRATHGDFHRGKTEELPSVILDNGSVSSIDLVEPLIGKLVERSANRRIWLAVPKEIKVRLGRVR
jgi:HD superfamily phosphohydrolase